MKTKSQAMKLVGASIREGAFGTALFLISCVSLHANPERALPKLEDIPQIESSAQAGDPGAQFDLARAYFRGIGKEQSPQQAIELLQKSAEQGFAEAYEVLGYFYSEGIGGEKNDALAVECFRKGAEAGRSVSQLNLGLLFRKGRGVERSSEEGIRWMTLAAEAGNQDAQFALGELYFLGDDYQSPEREKAIPLLRTVAEAGNAGAQNMLGVAFRDGLGGVETDPVVAESWFRKAAKQGDKKAQSNLGHLLGLPLPENPNAKEALMWLLLSEDQGETTAKKTLIELRPTINATLLVQARREADAFYRKQKLASSQPGTKNEARE